MQRLWRDQFGAAHLFRCGKAALAVGPDLAPLLRRVVLIREPPLGLRLDLQGIRLDPVRSCDQLIMRTFGLARRAALTASLAQPAISFARQRFADKGAEAKGVAKQMDISQERLNSLAARPSEGLNVEIKRWIDPTKSEGIAKIALASIALRNRNGGFLIIGFDNKTLLPDTNNAPADVRANFHVDIIQGIISKYASISFEVQVGFAERDGEEFPVIAIPEGTTVPVATKCELSNPSDKHKPLIRPDTVYFRTLGSNGTPSTSVAKATDWRDIIEICFENREADIGRFLRRHLGGDNLLRFITNAQEHLANLKPGPTPTERARLVLESGKKFRDEAIADRNLSKRDSELISLGSWSVALAIDPPLPEADSTQEFLNKISASNPEYTGWPVWLDSRSFAAEAHRPYKKQKAWEALILSTENGLMSNHVDFMRMSAKGEFYLWRILQDDINDKVGPKTSIDPSLMVYRVAEAIAVGISFARALGCDETSTLGFCFEWDHLKGRSLSSWANPEVYFPGGGKIQDAFVTSCIEVPFATPLPSIAPYVAQAVTDLFSAFDGFIYPLSGIEQRVEKLLNRRW